MQLEMVDKLYLELSQVTTAKTKRQLDMEDLLTSVRAIAQRSGESTAWERLDERIAALGIGSVTPRVFKVLPSDLENMDAADDSSKFDEAESASSAACWNDAIKNGITVYDAETDVERKAVYVQDSGDRSVGIDPHSYWELEPFAEPAAGND